MPKDGFDPVKHAGAAIGELLRRLVVFSQDEPETGWHRHSTPGRRNKQEDAMSTPVMPTIRPKPADAGLPEEKDRKDALKPEEASVETDAPPDISGLAEQGFRATKPER